MSSSAFASGFTRPRGTVGNEAFLNTDNLLVDVTSVADEEALVLAIAHGNYKDLGCAFASAVAVCAVHAELAKPLLGPADVPPALRRAILNANARIFGLAGADVTGRGIGTVMGVRTNLSGIGASVLAAVVTRREIVIAHIGENRALLVRDGRPRELVVPHTLWFAQRRDQRAQMESTEAAFAQDVVVRAIGLTDEISFDVLRSPCMPRDRLVLGNGGLRVTLDEPAPTWGGDAEALVDELASTSSERAPWVPPTAIVADVR